jgi:large subunit ribosomal protein L3
MKALIGRKLGMTQIFDEEGNVSPVTIIEAGPCVVTQVKTIATDGYDAIQIGFGEAKHQAKPQQGHVAKSKSNPSVMREVRTDNEVTADLENDDSSLKVGSKLDASTFEIGDNVQVTGTSKGKGFAGTVKRHNFATGPKTHGSHNYRAPGSIGSGYPQHVFKNMKMAGQMGHEQVTTRGLTVIMIDVEKNLLGIKGAVPGPRKSIVMVRAQ